MSSKKDSSEKIEDGQTIETVADQSEGAEDDQNKGAEADQIANDDNNQSMETTPDHSVAEVPGNVSIPMNAMVYNGHSYSIFDNNCSSWEQARNYCRSRGGYLAVINDSKEDDFLFGYMKDVGLNQVFFGFSDAESEGNWKWVEEGTINGNSEYLNWGTNDEGEKEPNEAIESENYAQLDANMVTGKWNDCSFDQDTTVYICEWDYVVK